MASGQSVELANAPQDVAVADYLANDLARQSVAISRDPVPGGPLVLVIGPASVSDAGLRAAAANAAEAGRPIHVVRLAGGNYDWPMLQGAASWTDAHGPAAQANVAALAARLRGLAPSAAAPSPWAWGAPSAPPPPSPWTGSPGAPRTRVGQPAPGWPPSTPSGGAEPSDKGSLIALFVIGGFGLVLLVLYLTGTLSFGSSATPTSTPPASTATPGPPASGGVTDQWLTGTWKENCASSESVRFDLTGGTVTFHNGAGRVSRSGNTLTITGSGGSIVMSVAYLSRDRMSATAQGGTQTLVRCG